MKKALALIITLLLALSLISCACVNAESDKEDRLTVLEGNGTSLSTYWYYVLKDTKTGVCYLCICTNNGGGGVSVMYDADGSVLIDKE